MRNLLALLLAALVAGLVASPVPARASKLDARARVALAQLQAPAANSRLLRAKGAAVSASGMLDVFVRGSIGRAELEAMGVVVRTELPGLYVAYVPPDAAAQLEGRADIVNVQGAALAEANLNTSVPTTGANLLRGPAPAFSGLNGSGVLVGDVDSGIDIHHLDFKDTLGLSRILYLWDQTAIGTPPAGYAIGAEWTKAQIDGGLCTETDVGAIATGGGHGTHVMGIAAGNGQGTGGAVPAYTYVGMAPAADIAMVKTSFYTTDIVAGVSYIFGRASATGKNAVVNLSLGTEYGPHDGTSDFESALDLLSGPGRVICVAAGNDRGTGWHAGMDIPAGGDSLKFTVSGGTANGRLLAWDGYYNAPDNFSVTLRSPAGLLIPLAMGAVNAPYPGAVTGVNGRVYLENGAFTTLTGAREVYLELTSLGIGTGATTGTWTLLFTPVAMSGGTSRFDMWRFYSSTTALSGSFPLHMTDDHLVSEPGNARRVITVAAWETKNNWTSCSGAGVSYSSPAPLGAIAIFSGLGPTRDGRTKPDIAAPGMGIGSTRSADATGACASVLQLLDDNGVHVINQGTSMAAPHVTGAAALLLQKFGAWTPEQVNGYLAAHAIVDPSVGVAPNTSWGAGKLRLGDLLDPTVAVTFPNGGEALFDGVMTALAWSASDNVGVTAVDLFLSRTGSAGPWETIASGVPNSGSYAWLPGMPATSAAWLRVVAHDAENNTAADLSDGAFQIVSFPTSTLLSTFVANATPRGIELHWQLADPGAFTSVSLERSTSAAGPWETLALAPAQDASGFAALDADVVDGLTYLYRLRGTRAGQTATLGQVSGTAGQPVTEFALTRVAPNPSRGRTSVEFTVPRAANVRVAVLDVQGREVAVLASGPQAPGRYQLSWSGEVNGRPAASGLYFVRMRAPGIERTRRVVISR